MLKVFFLNGDLNEDIYMQQPLGLINVESSSLICKLHKYLYGLTQAPRVWYDKIDTYFLNHGFKHCIYDPNLYVKHVDDNIIIIVLYVDDLIITGSQLLLIQNMKSELQKQFEMTDLSILHYFFGLQIWRMEDGILLSQLKYATDLLARFHMSDCKLAPTHF